MSFIIIVVGRVWVIVLIKISLEFKGYLEDLFVPKYFMKTPVIWILVSFWKFKLFFSIGKKMEGLIYRLLEVSIEYLYE